MGVGQIIAYYQSTHQRLMKFIIVSTLYVSITPIYNSKSQGISREVVALAYFLTRTQSVDKTFLFNIFCTDFSKSSKDRFRAVA